VGLDYLFSMVTVPNNFFIVGNNGNHGNQVGLDYLCTMKTKLFTIGNHGNYGNQAVYLRTLLALGTKELWISFEPLCRFS
jgi:hypothetical protein